MPDWIKLNSEQLNPMDIHSPNEGPKTLKAEDQKPLVEIKLSDSGDSVVLRTKARIDRKRGGFLGIGHQLWRGLRWALGIDVKKIEREQAEHGFDKGVDTLVEDLAYGIMTASDFFEKLDTIRKAGSQLQKTSTEHSGGAPESSNLTERFGENLSLCLLALKRESPVLFEQSVARLAKMSENLHKEISLLNFAASIQNCQKGTTAQDFNDRNASFQAYKAEIDALIDELLTKPSAAPSAESAPQISNVGRIN